VKREQLTLWQQTVIHVHFIYSPLQRFQYQDESLADIPLAET
jgi:hypothetical protein